MTWEEFLVGQPAQISVWGLVINLVLAAFLAVILSLVYTRYGNALSNRKTFARNFIIMAMTTALIITVIKASLALALGLVGALSIVRFRAAIKEPEELLYLFICIAIGVGLGADQRVITIVAFVIIMLAIILRGQFFHKKDENKNLHLTVSSHNPGKIELERIISILDKYCTTLNLKRFDETNEQLEATFLIEASDYKQLEKAKSELMGLSKSAKVVFLDSKGIY